MMKEKNPYVLMQHTYPLPTL